MSGPTVKQRLALLESIAADSLIEVVIKEFESAFSTVNMSALRAWRAPRVLAEVVALREALRGVTMDTKRTRFERNDAARALVLAALGEVPR